MKLFYQLLLSLLFAILVLQSGRSVQAQTFPKGSYIIDMGVVPQTTNNGLKPYGLVYALLQKGVPVAWSINSGKGKDGIDFVYNGKAYRGGPFIIAGEYASLAAPIISSWVASNPGLTVDLASTSFSAPVNTILNAAPRWVLDDQNGKIAQGFISAAGVPAATGGRPNYYFKDPQTLNCCDDVYVMPHADPTWETHSNLYDWNLSCKGAIWAACHAVSALENTFNPANPSQQMNFLANKTGVATGSGPYAASPGNAVLLWKEHEGGSTPYTFQHHNEPAMQFMGVTDDAMQNGSEQIYIPLTGWYGSTKVGAFDSSQEDVPGNAAGPAAVIAFGSAFGDGSRGKIMYEAAHNIGGADPDNIAAQRAFMNFSLWAGQEKAIKINTTQDKPTAISGGTTSGTFSASISSALPSGPYTYQWVSGCGGTFTNTSGTFNSPSEAATATRTTFQAPAAPTTSFNCPISCKITDACGRETFFSAAPLIQSVPVAPVANVDTKSTKPEVQVSVSPLTNDTDGNLDALTIKGIGVNGSSDFVETANGRFAIGPNSTVLYISNPGFIGVDSVAYVACDTEGLCSTSYVKITVAEAGSVGGGVTCGTGFTQALIGTGNAIGYRAVTSVKDAGRALGASDGEYAELDDTGDAVFTLDLGKTFATGEKVTLKMASASGGKLVTFRVEGGASESVAFSGATASYISATQAMANYTYEITADNTRYLKIQNRSTDYKGRVEAVTFPINGCVPVCAPQQQSSTSSKYGALVFSQSGVSNTEDMLGAPDGAGTKFDAAGDVQVLDLGEVLPEGSTVLLTMQLDGSADIPSTIEVSSSLSGGGSFGSISTYSVQTEKAAASYTYAIPSGGARFLKFSNFREGKKSIEVDAVKFVSVKCKTLVSSALDDNITVGEDNAITFNPLANDIDPQGLPLSVVLTSGPANGEAVVNPDGTVTYIPTLDYAGPDEITYKSCNAEGYCNTARIVINVVEDNCPTASQYREARYKTTTTTISGKDNVDDTWLDAEKPDESNGGASELLVDGESDQPNRALIKFSLRGIPSGAVITSAKLVLTKENSRGGAIRVYRVTSDWTEGSKKGGTATGESSWTYRQYNSAQWDLPGGDFDPNNLYASATVPGAKGAEVTMDVTKLVQAWTAGVSNYGFLVKAADETSSSSDQAMEFSSSEGSDSPRLMVTYQVADLTAVTCTAIKNRAPLAVIDKAFVNYNGSVTVNVAANDTDADKNLDVNSVVRIIMNGSPKYGTATSTGGTITYTPKTGSIKTDTVYYRISDNGSPSLSDTSMLIVNIKAIPITAVDDAGTVAGLPVLIDVASNDVNVLGGTVTIAADPSFPPSYGTVEVINGKIEYTPNPGFTGVDQFDYTICNSLFPAGCDVGRVTVTVQNQAPRVVNDTLVTQSCLCLPTTINILDNDFDPDGNALSLINVGEPSVAGLIDITVSGSTVSVSPTSSFTSGTVTIPYTIQDNGANPLTASGNIVIVYGELPPVVEGGVSSGRIGGLESESLGTALAERLFNNSLNSVPPKIDYKELIEVGDYARLRTNATELIGYMPSLGSKYVGYITSPDDILSYTNAKDVISIDYVEGGINKAVVFCTKTFNEIYTHTKPICDRLKGSVLLSVETKQYGEYQMLVGHFKARNGSDEYAISFSAGLDNNDKFYTLQSEWLKTSYQYQNTMYNFQLWSSEMRLLDKMVLGILNKLGRELPLEQVGLVKIPASYVTMADRDQENLLNLKMTIKNFTSSDNGILEISGKANEQSDSTIVRKYPVTLSPFGEIVADLPIGDIAESEIKLIIMGTTEDIIYTSDGLWNIFSTPSTEVRVYRISNDKIIPQDTEYRLFRNVKLEVVTSDYVTVYRVVRGGGIAANLADYKYLKFNASGNSKLRIRLVQESVVKFEDQYEYLLTLTPEKKSYTVPISEFKSAGFPDPTQLNDLVIISFSYEAASPGTQISTELSNVRFAKDEILAEFAKNEFIAYPNPTRARINYTFESVTNDTMTMDLVSASTGIVVLSEQVSVTEGVNVYTTELSPFISAGLYILRVHSDRQQYSYKVIIK